MRRGGGEEEVKGRFIGGGEEVAAGGEEGVVFDSEIIEYQVAVWVKLLPPARVCPSSSSFSFTDIMTRGDGDGRGDGRRGRGELIEFTREREGKEEVEVRGDEVKEMHLFPFFPLLSLFPSFPLTSSSLLGYPLCLHLHPLPLPLLFMIKKIIKRRRGRGGRRRGQSPYVAIPRPSYRYLLQLHLVLKASELCVWICESFLHPLVYHFPLLFRHPFLLPFLTSL